jgi:1-phosphofructokinase family hexose kinase
MIVVAGFNTALDKLIDVDVLRAGDVQRIQRAQTSFGGKGLHVAQTIAALGERVRLVGLVDAAQRSVLKVRLRERRVEFYGIQAPGPIRNCLAIREADGRITELLEPGPELDAATRTTLVDTFRRLALDSELAVLSGSLPPGFGDDTYADLVRELQGAGVRCLVDASGAALLRAIRARPFLIKPNRDEAAALLERPVAQIADAAAAVRALVAQGVAMPVLSLGADGVVAANGDDVLHANVEPVRVGNAVGSGDCLVAGLAVGLIRGDKPEDILRLGTACGTANAAVGGSGDVHRADVEALLPRVRIRRISAHIDPVANFSEPDSGSRP